MPTPRKNQKQVAQQYAGNRRYFKFLHPLRRARILLVLVCLLISIAIALIYLSNSGSSQRFENFSSPGELSDAHRGKNINCASCHDTGVKPDLAKPAVVYTPLDANCEACHAQHTFHQADVVASAGRSCVDCHHEHLGAGPMQQVKDENCLSCHGNADVMAASAQKGFHLSPDDFQIRPRNNVLAAFQPQRPPQGYTQVFQSFEKDHPDFQIQRDHLTDPNTLKFNHKFHLSSPDIPEVDGHKLDCAYCHKPDSRGTYVQPISFAKNCQACHALLIDPKLADFQIPHPTGGSQVNSVRNFLLTLPTQYASYATEKKKLTDPGQVAAFVNEHMMDIRQRIREGADLEDEVFFSNKGNIHSSAAMALSAPERALFVGSACDYCHEVKPAPAQAPSDSLMQNYTMLGLATKSPAPEPVVTPPITPNRWYVHARFDHAAHVTMNCNTCHAVRLSEKTPDISLPDKASCVICHSVKGGVASTCATCHDYHNQTPVHGVAGASSLRQMMLGMPTFPPH